ncbi:MAG: hypothetical protein AAGF89_13710 [Bacteroidota bacterium]
MAKSSRSYILPLTLLSLFALAFLGYLGYAAYLYLIGAENVTIKSLAPGLPGIYLAFMAHKQWKGMQATKKVEAHRRRKALAETE